VCPFDAAPMCAPVGGQRSEVIAVDDVACIAMAKAPVDVQDGRMGCLMGHDLTDYDYVSVCKGGFVPISVNLMTSATRLSSNTL
jgi:hypothetical protein